MSRVQQTPDAALRRLTRGLATPFYLYEEKSLRANVQALFAAFSWNMGFCEYLPLRRCRNPALLKLLHEAGCGAVCSDFAQLRVAAACGFEGPALIYAPMLHHDGAEALAYALDATWLIDGAYILPPRPPRRVLLRCNPGGRLQVAGRTLANFDRIRYGMRPEELFDLARRFDRPETESVGLTVTACDNCLDPDYYPAVAKTLFRLAVQMREATGLSPDVCNLGGGFGISSSPAFASPALEPATEQIRALAEEILTPAGLRQVRLQTMLDRRLLLQTAKRVVSVTAVREREVPLYFVDAEFGQTPLLGGHPPVTALCAARGRGMTHCCVSGCQDSLSAGLGDRYVLPCMKPGERLVVHMAGFDEIPQDVPVYLLREDGTVERI